MSQSVARKISASKSASKVAPSSAWHGLDANLSRKNRTVRVGDTTFALNCLEDMEDAFQQSFKALPHARRAIAAGNTAELTPHFGVVWPSAVGLSEHVQQFLDSGNSPAIALELGCGLGLPSMVAAKQGVRRVIATDRHPLVSQFLARNVESNSLQGIDYQPLDWRDLTETSTLGLKQKVDLLLGSDLLYEAWQPGFLAAAVAHLLAPDGVAMLADPGRKYMDEFMDLSAAHHIACRETCVRRVQLGETVSDVLVIELVWKNFQDEKF
jgi:predicted nicotinamide N-methyase